MKAIVLAPRSGGEGLAAEVREVDVPKPGPGELVVRMWACGLCGTDLEKIRGEYTASRPVVGHEAVGAVYSVGKGVRGFKEGDRVFPHHHVPDNACYLCRAGNETMCERYRGSNLDPGGFSEYFRVPRWNVAGGGVLKLPRGMRYDVASLVEPLACCVRSVRKGGIRARDSVLIVGAGPVGMMHALILKETSAKVMLSDLSKSRLAFAERLRAGVPIDATSDVPRGVAAETGGRGADVAVVASGSEAAIVQGLRSVRKGGRVILFGVPPRGSVLDYDVSELYNSERRVLTSYGATEEDTKPALRILASRQAEFDRLITHRFSLGRFADAMRAATEVAGMKVILTP